MRLSFIIPVLNESDALNRLLPMLSEYRKRGHEIILVDGGSTDDSVNRAVSKVDQLITCEPGRARQMNIGASAASGDWLVFLHADTQLPQNIDEIIQKESNNRSHVWGRFDVRLSGRQGLFRVIEKAINWRSRISGIATGDQAIFVQRDAFNSIDGYPEIALMEDIEISNRLKRLSPPICISEPVITSSRRWEKNGIINTVVQMWHLRFLYFAGVKPEKLAERYYSKSSGNTVSKQPKT